MEQIRLAVEGRRNIVDDVFLWNLVIWGSPLTL